MAIKSIQRGPAAGGAPVSFLNRPNASDIYVDGSTNALVFGAATSGTTSKTALDGTTTGQVLPTPYFHNAASGAAISEGRLINRKTAIADATLTDTFTVTVPNAAHACSIFVYVLGSMGAGGAIGAFESNSASQYNMSVARTAGVAAVIATSAQLGVANGKVAGADTLTATIAASAVTGANSATQTFTIQITITKGAGASANHQAIVVADILNANASGITIATA